jgi:hypothetical protein
MFEVIVTDKRIQQAYQNVLEGRPSASEIILKTESAREAIEKASELIAKKAEYEIVAVKDTSDGEWVNIDLAKRAMAGFDWNTDYRNGKKIAGGVVKFPKMGAVKTKTELRELWERMEIIYWTEH